MREGIQNWLIVFSIIIVSGVIVYFALPKKQTGDNKEVKGTEAVDYKHVPYITSISPISVDLGETFEYEVVVSDLDNSSEEIEITLTESPEWMEVKDGRVVGQPDTLGAYKFVVAVSDGVNTSSQVNYLLVEEK